MISTLKAAEIFEISCHLVELWATRFAEYLSKYANPEEGLNKQFTRKDIQILAVVSYYWEEEPDYESIISSLNSGLYREDFYREFALLHTSLIQDPLDEEIYEGDEAWTRGFLVGDILTKFHQIEIARSYKLAADSLVTEIEHSPDPLDYAYPILFLYRHCLELYLKAILDDENKKIHSLDSLMNEIEEKYKKKIPIWMKSRLLDFHSIDPRSTSFRYLEKETEKIKPKLKAGEINKVDTFWIDFEHLNLVVNSLCSTFEDLAIGLDLHSR